MPGTFCWVELGTTDLGAARKFYSSVFGWNLSDMPNMPPGMVYAVASVAEGKNVGGLTTLPDEAKKMGARPNWMSYVAVENAEESAKKVTSLGGKFLMGPADTGPGVMGIVQDPTGAVFALWQEKQSMGTVIYQEVGGLSWNELSTTDVDRAGKFYANLFGWKTEAVQMPNMTYTTFKQGDKFTGGMMAQPKEMAGAPSMWTAYFEVKDADATAKKIESAGGKSFGPMIDVPDVGRFGFFADPQGAMFAVIKSTQQAK